MIRGISPPTLLLLSFLHSFIQNCCRITPHLPTPEGWKAELAWVAGYVVRPFSCSKVNPSQYLPGSMWSNCYSKPPGGVFRMPRPCMASSLQLSSSRLFLPHNIYSPSFPPFSISRFHSFHFLSSLHPSPIPSISHLWTQEPCETCGKSHVFVSHGFLNRQIFGFDTKRG